MGGGPSLMTLLSDDFSSEAAEEDRFRFFLRKVSSRERWRQSDCRLRHLPFLLPSAISDSLRHELTLDLRVLIAFKFEAGSHRDYVVTHTRTHYGHSEEGLADLAHTYSAQLSNY